MESNNFQTAKAVFQAVLQDYDIAETKPRVICSRCNRQNCLDLPWITVPICDSCMDRIEKETQGLEQAESLASRYKSSGLPAGYLSARFADFKTAPNPAYQSHLQAVARRLWQITSSLIPAPDLSAGTGNGGTKITPTALAGGCKGGVKGALLLGPTGAGKTHLLAAAANRLLQHVPIRWIDLTELQHEIARSVFQKEKEPVEPFGKRIVREFDIIFLDDFTFDKSTYDWLVVGVQQFINDLTAQGSGVRVFLSTNNRLDAQKLKDPVSGKPDRDENIPSLTDLFKDRTVSRLFQLMTPIHLTGPNRRISPSL